MTEPPYKASDADEARLAALVATATYRAGVLTTLRGPYLEADAQAEASARAVRAEHYARARREADAANAHWETVKRDASVSLELRADALEAADDCTAWASFLEEDFTRRGYRIDDEYAHERGLKPSTYPFEQAPPGPQYNQDGTSRQVVDRDGERRERRAAQRAEALAAAERYLTDPDDGADRTVHDHCEDDGEIPF